jgi:hypothetical protein
MLILAVVAAIIGLPLFALLAAGLQWLVYRYAVRAEESPWFGLLVMRGMLVGLAVMVGLAIWSRLGR